MEYEEGDKGEEFVAKAKFKAESMLKLVELSEKYGAYSKEPVNQLKEMYNSHHFKNDKQIEWQVKLYKKMKLW